MAEKDLSEKYLEEYPDVFADIVNVLLLGKDYIRPDELYSGPTESIYKAESGLAEKEQRRDISKYFIRDSKIMALIGIENQSYADCNMPVRVMGYDYASYRSQIINDRGRYPVITLVLNFTNNKWDSPISLKDYPEYHEKLHEFIPDYRIRIINVAYIPENVRMKLKSDFKIIADFFTERRKKGGYIPTDEQIKHEMAVLYMLRVFTGDERYEQIKKNIKKRKAKGEVVTMCTFADEMENKGISKGRIMEAVSIYSQEMHLNNKDVLNKIMQKFGLKSDEARRYIESGIV